MSIDLSLLPDAKRRKPFTNLDGTGHRNRMRLRVINKGASTLEDYEILEMLLYCVIPRRDTKPLAKQLINHFGSLRKVLLADTKEIHEQVASINFKYLVIFLRQIALRLYSSDGHAKLYLKRWKDIILYLNEDKINVERLYGNSLRILFLNGQQRLIADEYIIHNDIQSIAIIFRKAIELHASNLIVVSYIANDLNADLKQKEVNFSSTLQNAALPFGLNISEYIVHGNGQYYSVFTMKHSFQTSQKKVV